MISHFQTLSSNLAAGHNSLLPPILMKAVLAPTSYDYSYLLTCSMTWEIHDSLEVMDNNSSQDKPVTNKQCLTQGHQQAKFTKGFLKVMLIYTSLTIKCCLKGYL